ncbi:MAG: DUF515 domain-containing protein [Candidatus Hydrothermarchaeaceae archaeon]
MAEKKPEDIIDRLEALRKRVPEEEKPPTEEPSVEGRRKKARVVGIVVVLLILFGIFWVAYKFVWQPRIQQAIETIEEDRAREQARLEEERRRRELEKQAFLNSTNQKFNEIRAAFRGLPPAYATARSVLEDEVSVAEDIMEVQAVDVETPANEAWRNYRLAQMDSLVEAVGEIELKVDEDVFRSVPDIRQRILSLSYGMLKNATLRELRYEYVPMWGARERGLYFPEENMIVNIYYRKNENETIYLAKDAKVISILRADSSGEIALAESETRSRVGGGVEGVGTVPSLSIGGTTGTLTGTFTGSAGTAMSQTQTTLTIDLSEVQKAYAANKISESDFNALMNEYGMRLDDIEESTGFGEFGVEYLILVRVTADEAPGLVLRLFTPEDRDKIYVTFTSRSSSS